MQSPSPTRQQLLSGIGFALLTCIIWSGNFVLAKGITNTISPVSLSFYRLCGASILMLLIGYKTYRKETAAIWQHRHYLIISGAFGFALYSTLLYIGGNYTSAINLALIGCTSSPIFAVVLGVLFFHQTTTKAQLLGMATCALGILLLISDGRLRNLTHFTFAVGDWWMLAGSFSFALYNNYVKKRPLGISNVSFLTAAFVSATFLLFPVFLIELFFLHPHPIIINLRFAATFLYLSLGCSVMAFLMWNKSIHIIGPGRTALFGNLIPILSTIQAILLLHEPFKPIHIWSGLLILLGLAIANLPTISANKILNPR